MRKIFTLIGLAILLAANIQLQAQNSFTALNGIPGGEIIEVHKDSNGILYTVIRGEGQIFTSADNGSTWELFDVGSTDVYAFYADNSDLYYFTYSNMYKSTDFGVTWTKVNSDFSSFVNIRKAHKSPIDPNTWIVEGECEGVFVSTDDGVTWTNIVTEICGIGNYGDYKLIISASGDIYYENRSKGILRHKYPTDGIWSSQKVELIFTKQPSDDDYSLRVALSMSGRVFISHRDINSEFRISSSTTGNSGSFSEFTLPVTTNDLYNSVISRGFNGNIYLISYFENEMYELTNESTPTWTVNTHPLNQYATDNIVELNWFSVSEVYACSNHTGIFRSLDGGSSWQMANGSGSKSLNYGWVSDLEVLPNGNIVAFPQYAPKGNWVSTDQGATFTYNSFGEESRMRENGNGLTKLQDNSLIMSNQVGAMRSTDGINWSVVSADNAPLFLPVGSSDVYYIRDSETNLFKTTLSDISDGGGVTLTTVTAGLPNNSYIRRAVQHDGDIYVDLQNYNNGQQWELWKVETSVSPFTSQKLILPFVTDQLVGLESVGNKLYISNREQVAYSSNQGVSWATINYVFHERLLGISQDGNEGIAVAYRGGVAITQDDGSTWTAKSVPSSGGLVTSLAKDAAGNFIAALSGGPVSKFEGKLVVSAAQLPAPVNVSWQPLNGPYGGQINGLTKDSQDNIYGYSRGIGIFKLTSGTSTWQKLNTGLGEGRMAYIDESDNIYAVDYNQIAKSTDFGATWTTISCCDRTVDNANIIIANNGNIIVTSGEGGEGLYVSTDNGTTFSKPLGSGSKGAFYELVKSGSGRLWTHQRNNGQSTIYTSTDNGINWQALNTIDLSNGKQVLALNVLEGNVIAVVTDTDILRSTDDGANWNSIKGSITTIEHYDVGPPAESSVYLAPDNSYYFYNLQEIYKSTDQGQTWSEVSNLTQGLYDYEKSDFVWLNNDIIASSPSRSILRSVGGTSNWTDYIDGLTGVYSYKGSFVGAGSNLLTAPNGYGALYKSIDDGQSFSRYSRNDGYFDGLFKDPNGRFIRFGGGVSFSDDNGSTWSNNLAEDYFFAKLTAYKNESSGEITYYALRDKNNPGEFAKSTDLVNWTTLGSSSYVFNGQNAEDIIAAENDILYIKGYNNLSDKSEFYRIAFGAAEKITDQNTVATQRLQLNLNASEPIDVNDIKKVFVLYGNQGKLAYSADGYTWKTGAAPPSQDGRQFKITSNGYYFINDTETGRLWISKDEGSSWQFTNGFVEDMFEVEINSGNGYAYAISRGQVLQKSNTIILEDDLTSPVIVSAGGLAPENGAINVALTFKLELTYDENVIPVAGKKIRLLEVNNPGTPLEIFDATDGTISTDGTTITFTPGITIDYSTEYFVAMDAGAYTDIFGNPGPAITSTSDWAFTTLAIPDNTAPVISLTTTDITYENGSAKTFEINVTDNNEVDALGATIYYRKISDPSETAFKSAEMNASGNDAPSLDFTISPSDGWYDAIGLEFYIEVADKAQNTARYPTTDNTYLYSYIDYSNFAPTIGGLGFGETASSYKIIAVPWVLVDNQISTQFDALGEPNKEKYRIGTYNNSKEDFDEYPETLKTVGRGKGYWFIMKNFTDIEPSTASSPQNNRDDFFKISLQPGWNQIGNPYPMPISWEEVRAQDSNVGQLKVYNNGTFANGDELSPFQGGFVFATAAVPDLVIRFKGITTGGRVAGHSYDLASEDWQIPITIEQGEFTNAIGGIGMAPEAKAGQDNLDDFNPPTITHRLELQFDNEDAVPLAKSVVKTETKYSWSFTAYTGGKDMVSLKWDNSNFGENKIGLWLYDEERVAFVDMRAHTEYKYVATPQKKFKIYYGELPELEVMPSFSLLGEPWPNPASGKLKIPFAINKEHGTSAVVINIFDAQGRLIKELTNKAFEPGTHQLEWLPNRSASQLGLHLIQWNMVTENGDRLQETKRVLVK